MTPKIFFLQIVFLLSMIGLATAQNIPAENRTAVKRLVSQAEKSFSAKDYGAAISIYQKIDSLAPGIPEVKCNIGICYIHSRHKAKALPYFESAKQNGYAQNDIYYYLGQAYHYNFQFEKAIKSFQEYINVSKADTLSALFTMADTRRKIEISGFAIEHVEDSLEVTIENMGDAINTSFDEYVPIVSADEKTLYFTSRRPTEFNDELFRDGKHYEDVHVSKKDASGKWMPATVVPYPINNAEHDACIGISGDARTMFLFRTKEEDPSLGNIYMSKFDNIKWSTPEKLGGNVNTPRGWESSISVSGSNKRLYFSSDRPGGYGGFDIWYCDLLNTQQWGEPQNLGPDINTKYNEDCPFIHSDDNTLFFSSDGHNTMGGFDVFSSVYSPSTKKWTKPKNIGYPINSVDDDMYFIYSKDGSKGYMSTSLRPDTKGGNDIYSINRPLHSFRLLTLRGKILNAEDDLPVEGTITVTDLSNNKVIGVFRTIGHTGKYAIPLEKDKQYSVQFESENMLFASENLDLHDPEAIFLEKKTFSLKPIKNGNTIVLNNIFFEYNDYDLKNESLPELNKLTEFLKKNPSLRIKLKGHTDSIGEEAYNIRLSKKRANEVRTFLQNNGIAKSRMIIEGLGESQPVASNATEEGRKMNRYTDCQVFNIDTLPDAEKLLLSRADTADSESIILEGIVPTKKQGVELYPYASFKYNNGKDLDEQSKKHLDEIAAAMKRIPSLKLTVLANTDIVGNEYNNNALHEARVKTTLDYFTSKGVASNRFVVAPFESKTKKKVAEIAKGSEENRRVKFTLSAL